MNACSQQSETANPARTVSAPVDLTSILANRRKTVDERLVRHDAALAEILALRQAVLNRKRHA